MFRKGDRVMYPNHGAAAIEALVERDTSGERRTYMQLHFVRGQLTIMVPVDNAEQVGVREVISPEEIEKVFAFLREEEGWTPPLWSQRYKLNLAKLVSGDVYQGAELVRDLSIRQSRRPLSPAEKRILDRAREILISELSYAIDCTGDDAEAMLDQVLAEPKQRRRPRRATAPSAMSGR